MKPSERLHVPSKLSHRSALKKIFLFAVALCVALCLSLCMAACGGSGDSGGSSASAGSAGSSGSSSSGSGGHASSSESTSGAAFNALGSIEDVSYNAGASVQGSNCSIDTSHVSDGYVAATGNSSSRLKFQVANGDRTYNYDMPNNGTPVFVPLNMGNGSYTFRVMQNTSGSNYIELLSTSANVNLSNEFEPFLHPNLFCSFTNDGTTTRLARELTANCATQADALRAICSWITQNVTYDNAKAERLSTGTGYIPNPEETLASKSGICFDYASLGAAMLRSVGIPTKVITGYVSPNGLYHAWIMVYIDGTWQSAEFKVSPRDWSRVDLTYAATRGGNSYVGDGIGYQDRYVY